MAEQLSLSSNEVVPQKVTSYYRISRLTLDWDEARITILVRGEQGERKEFTYENAIATTLMVFLNKVNLSVKSLQARVLERLSTDGKLVGTVTGTPD